MSDNQNGFKLFLLLFETSSDVLRHYLGLLLKVEEYNSIVDFLNAKIHELFYQAYPFPQKQCCCGVLNDVYTKNTPRNMLSKFHWELLYDLDEIHSDYSEYHPCQFVCNPNLTLEDLDLVLMVQIINICFTKISEEEKVAVNSLRRLRNRIAHLPTLNVTDEDFFVLKKEAEHAFLTLTRNLSDSYQSELQQSIQNIIKAPLDDRRHIYDQIIRTQKELDLDQVQKDITEDKTRNLTKEEQSSSRAEVTNQTSSTEHLPEVVKSMIFLRNDLKVELENKGIPFVYIWVVESAKQKGDFLYLIQTKIEDKSKDLTEFNQYPVKFHIPTSNSRGLSPKINPCSRKECDFKYKMNQMMNQHLHDLMNAHSNLVDITVTVLSCPLCSGEPVNVEDVVIELYCPIVGYIPVGEPKFPNTIKLGIIEYKTIVLEDVLYSACHGPNDPLARMKIGCSVSTNLCLAGTLGPCFRDPITGSIYAAGCAHVFFSKDQLVNSYRYNIPLVSQTEVPVYQPPLGATGSREIGKVKCAKIVPGNVNRAGVDGAVIELHRDFYPEDGTFCSASDDQLAFCGFPMNTKPFFSGGIEKDIDKLSYNHVYLYGKESGWKKGTFYQQSHIAKPFIVLNEFGNEQLCFHKLRKVLPFLDDDNKTVNVIKFAVQGDSGAGVFTRVDSNLVLIGILCSVTDYGAGYVIPIGDFLECLSYGHVNECLRFPNTPLSSLEDHMDTDDDAKPMTGSGFAASSAKKFISCEENTRQTDGYATAVDETNTEKIINNKDKIFLTNMVSELKEIKETFMTSLQNKCDEFDNKIAMMEQKLRNLDDKRNCIDVATQTEQTQ